MVYDACAIVAVLFAERSGIAVRGHLDSDGSPAMAAVNFSEALVQFARRTGACRWPGTGDRELRLVPLDAVIATRAAELYFEVRVKGKRDDKLSLADCTALATALEHETKVVTTDKRFAAFDSPAVIILE